VKLADADADTRRAAFGNAGEVLGIPLRQLEKDFWVTSVLRALSTDQRGRFLFKGGTSLSKGWNVIRRFSEDIDLLLLSEPGVETDALLDQMATTAETACASSATVRSRTEGYARVIEVPYPELSNTPKAPGLRRAILLEPGVRGGPRPQATIQVAPLLVEGLPKGASEGWEDLQPFEIEALHPGRTFVEKLFAVHGLATGLAAESDRAVRGTEARHFYDLYFLADRTICPALDLLEQGDTYTELVDDCQRVSARWFPDRPATRPARGFRFSPAFADDALAGRIGPAFDRTMRQLCYPGAPRPTLDDVRVRLRALEWL